MSSNRAQVGIYLFMYLLTYPQKKMHHLRKKIITIPKALVRCIASDFRELKPHTFESMSFKYRKSSSLHFVY